MSDSAPLAVCHTGPAARRSRTAAPNPFLFLFFLSFSPLLFFSLHPPSLPFLLIFTNPFSSSFCRLFPFFFFLLSSFLHPPSPSGRIGTHTECLHTYIQNTASSIKLQSIPLLSIPPRASVLSASGFVRSILIPFLFDLTPFSNSTSTSTSSRT